jgi:arylsulfatase A-like enzyme
MTGGHNKAAAENGVIFARGRGISPGAQVADVSVNDITPTILAWLGLPLAKDMDGSPASFLEVELAEPVPTFDTTPIERIGEAPPGLEEEVIDELRALGYVD